MSARAPVTAARRFEEVLLKQPKWKAIFTDSHFWLPVVVLVIGITLLAAVR